MPIFPEEMLHWVAWFMSLPLTLALMVSPVQINSQIFHSPTGFSVEGPCLESGWFGPFPSCSLHSAPAIKNKSPCLSCCPWHCTHFGQSLSGSSICTSTPVLSAFGATFTKRHSTVSL